MRPLIGLNTSLIDMDDPLKAKAVCHFKYIDAVAAAGGIPIVVPPFTDRSMLDPILSKLDGFCLIGGPDYDPAHYSGHAQPPSEIMHARRHQFDLWLAEHLLEKTQKPVLGVCGGHQLINISRGGALVQDIRSEWKPTVAQACTLQHADSERKGTPHEGNAYRHQVKLTPGSRIAKIAGAVKILTNSYHHQSVPPDRIGKGLIATGWTSDGVIEALETTEADRFILGVQWHPERQTDEAQHLAIFAALIDAAKQ
jgi:putative glutamine amidotransferase